MVLARALNRAFGEAVQLLPRGDAWTDDSRSVLHRLLAGLAGPRARLEVRALEMLEEADPRTTTELLSDWERVLGLPDECLPAPETLADRRALATARSVGVGSGTPAAILALIRAAGFQTVSIVEKQGTPFRCGTSACGDAIGPGLESLVWEVHLPATTVRRFACGTSACGDPLVYRGNEVAECIVQRVAPAHTLAVFVFSDVCYLVVYDENGDAVRIDGTNDAIQVLDELGAPVDVPIASEAIQAQDENGDPVSVSIVCE